MADIRSIITGAAGRYGIDPDVLLRIAHIESKLDPRAQNPNSSAGGLFQFIDKTWASYGRGHKYDPHANADAGARFVRDNIKYLRRELGREPTPGEIYLAHQQGAGGAMKLLRTPNARAMDIVGADAIRLNGGHANMTAGEFAQLWDRKMGGASTGGSPQFSTVSPTVSPTFAGNTFGVDRLNDPAFTPIVNGTVRAPNPVTMSEMNAYEAQQRAEQGERPGFFEAAGAAIGREWSVAQIFKGVGERYTPDPEWKLTEESLRKLTEALPRNTWDAFADATSEAHAEAIRKRILNELDAEEKLNRMGALGVGLRMTAAFTDPGAWAATIALGAATGGVGLGPAVAARFGRAGMIGLGAAEGVAANVMVDTPLIANDPLREWDDLKWSVGAGLVMGGAFGAISRTPMLEAEARRLQEIGKSMQDEAITATLNRNLSAGAAHLPAKQDLRLDTYELRRASEKADVDVVGSRFRFDLSNTLKSSKNPLTRAIGNVFVEDAVRATKGKVTPIGASEEQAKFLRKAEVSWRKAYDSQWEAYRKRKGYSIGQVNDARSEFSNMVSRAVRSRNGLDDFEPEVQKVAAEVRQMMNQWREMANNPGILDGTIRRPVGGAGGLERNDHYLPRIFNLSKLRELLDEFGNEGVTTLIATAMRRVNPEVAEATATKFARGYVTKLHRLSAGGEVAGHRAFSGEDLDGLQKLLSDTDLSPDEVQGIVNLMKPKKQEGAVTRMKHRMLFDETFEANMMGKSGSRTVRIDELFNNDIDFLMQAYNRQMSGYVSLARLRVRNPEYKPGMDDVPEFLVDGITKDSEFDLLLSKVQAVGESKGMSVAEIKKDLDALRFTYNAIKGNPNWDETSNWAQALRLLRDYNFLRVMGQVGFAQIPELMVITGQVGLKTMLQSIPGLRAMWRGKDKQLNDALSREWEELTGGGTDWLRLNTMFRNDDISSAPSSMMANPTLARIEEKSFHAKRFVNAASGMAPINTFLQRITGRAIMNAFAKAALGKTKLSPHRLRALGLEDEMVERIYDQIRKNSKFDEGLTGKKLRQLDIGSWADLEAANALENAMFRWSRSAIQENDIGQMAMFMSAPLARTVLQFRTFMIGAWSKQLLQGANMRDWQTFVSFTGTVFFGAMTYMAQTHLNAIGRSDRDKFLERRLDPGNVAYAALSRSSWFSLFAPVGDMGKTMLTGSGFEGIRTTGLPSQAVFGNPTMDLIDGFMQSGEKLMAGVTGDRFSQADAGHLRRLLPFQNLMGITQLYNATVSGLPERSSRK